MASCRDVCCIVTSSCGWRCQPNARRRKGSTDLALLLRPPSESPETPLRRGPIPVMGRLCKTQPAP
eukprot:893015-Alexandrium_andersonii.AAC.1